MKNFEVIKKKLGTIILPKEQRARTGTLVRAKMKRTVLARPRIDPQNVQKKTQWAGAIVTIADHLRRLRGQAGLLSIVVGVREE
jgi:hypothetical protein